MREQKIKSLPLFPNVGETKFIANYLHAVRTPLPFGRGWGWAPSLFCLFGRGWGWVPLIHKSRVEQT